MPQENLAATGFYLEGHKNLLTKFRREKMENVEYYYQKAADFLVDVLPGIIGGIIVLIVGTIWMFMI